jgi:integrase
MELINRANYHLVNEYLNYLVTRKNKKETTVQRYRFHLRHLLMYLMSKHVSDIHKITKDFSAHINALELSNETKKKITLITRSFLVWCKNYHELELKSLPNYWIEDLTPCKVSEAAELDPVTEEEIFKIAKLQIDPNNLALLRDQAAACLLFLSAARGGALTTLPIRAVVLENSYPHLLQYPELGVKTKLGKKLKTFLYDIPELMEPVIRWHKIVKDHCDEGAPWYLPINHSWGEQVIPTGIINPGANRGTALNRRLEHVWRMAGEIHKSPHKFRHGSILYGVRRCTTMAQYHQLSRNGGHSSIHITDKVYVKFEEEERGATISSLARKPFLNPTIENTPIFQTELMNEYPSIDNASSEELSQLLVLIAKKIAGNV